MVILVRNSRFWYVQTYVVINNSKCTYWGNFFCSKIMKISKKKGLGTIPNYLPTQ